MAFCCNPLCVCRELSETRDGIGPVFRKLAEVRTAPSLGSLPLPDEACLMPTACVHRFICQMIFAIVLRSENLSLQCFRFPTEGNCQTFLIVIIYSPSSSSKPVRASFFLLNTKYYILKNVGNQTVDGCHWLPYHFHSVLWKSMATINCLVTNILLLGLEQLEEIMMTTGIKDDNFYFGVNIIRNKLNLKY